MRSDKFLRSAVIAFMIAASASGDEKTETSPGLLQWDDLRKFSLELPLVQQLAADLHAAGGKLKVPAQKRRTVSIMGIVAEKRDVDLVNAARSLHAFLERDLQACDDVVTAFTA